MSQRCHNRKSVHRRSTCLVRNQDQPPHRSSSGCTVGHRFRCGKSLARCLASAHPRDGESWRAIDDTESRRPGLLSCGRISTIVAHPIALALAHSCTIPPLRISTGQCSPALGRYDRTEYSGASNAQSPRGLRRSAESPCTIGIPSTRAAWFDAVAR